MRYLGIFLISGLIIQACTPVETDTVVNKQKAVQEINTVLDDWHNAAAEGDFERYFNYFENDTSIFMGTDATERWAIGEFRPWSRPYFEDDGVAWTFTPTFREVYVSDSGETAWFDEELDTPNLGPSRGSGVLVFTNQKNWKIAHYNLTVPIPNAIVDSVKNQIEAVLKIQNEN